MQKKYTKKIREGDFEVDIKRSGFNKFYEEYRGQTKVCKELKLACEVEKIMILLNLDRNGKIKV